MKFCCDITLGQAQVLPYLSDAKSDLNVVLCGASWFLFIHFLLRRKKSYQFIQLQYLEAGGRTNPDGNLTCMRFGRFNGGEGLRRIIRKNTKSVFIRLCRNDPSAPRGQNNNNAVYNLISFVMSRKLSLRKYYDV